MKFGERMSRHVIFENLVWNSTGDIFDGPINEIRDVPLDIGRLFYAKLRSQLQEDVHVEVIWNHVTNRIAIDVESASGRKFETDFLPETMARTDLVQRVDQFCDMVRSIVDE